MTAPNGKRRDRAAELPDAEARLRELLAEAHGAIRDMDRLLREMRAITSDNAKAAADAAFRSACEEMSRFSAHFQRQMNQAAAELNVSVEAARHQVMDAITPSEIIIDEESGHLVIKFGGELFDAEVPVASMPAPLSLKVERT